MDLENSEEDVYKRQPGRLGLAGRHDAERLVEGLRQRGIDHRPARPRYAK